MRVKHIEPFLKLLCADVSYILLINHFIYFISLIYASDKKTSDEPSSYCQRHNIPFNLTIIKLQHHAINDQATKTCEDQTTQKTIQRLTLSVMLK